jgi:hypothetical protein
LAGKRKKKVRLYQYHTMKIAALIHHHDKRCTPHESLSVTKKMAVFLITDAAQTLL